MSEYKTTQVKISDLRPAEYNPRQMTKRQADDLKVSIEKFGIVDPIIVNSHEGRENIIIGGHQRVKIAQILGFTEVPVFYLNLDEEKERELNLRLNKSGGEWDNAMLTGFEPEMLKDVGFTKDELESRFDVKIEEDGQDKLEPEESTNIKKGDLFKLGEHRLLCGDATDYEDFNKLFDGKKARLIFTDPPYMVDYKSQSNLTYDSNKYGGSKKIFNDNLKEADALNFYKDVLENLKHFTTDDVTIFWWFANNKNHINRQAWIDTDWSMSQIIIWIKNGMVFGRGQLYHRKYEPCMVGWKKGRKHFRNKHINNLDDVINLDFDDYVEMMDVWYESRGDINKYVHPTQKPVKLPERALKKSSQAGDIVIDCFGGSGSTLMACEQLGRRCYMMELDPNYCAVIIKRWEKFTGELAEKI